MDMDSAVALIVAAAALGLNLVLALKSGSWGMADRLTAMEKAIMDAVNANKHEVDKEIDVLRAEIYTSIEVSERRFGETAEAIRHKVNDVELYIRDTYARRDSLLLFMQESRDLIKDSVTRLEVRLDRMEKKIDDARSVAARRSGEDIKSN